MPMLPRRLRQALLPVLLCAASAAHAGYVTLNEPKLDRIFAQAGVDIRFDAPQVIHNSAWLEMDLREFDAALAPFATGLGLARDTVPAFFIDAFAPDVGYGVIGLGWLGSPGLAVVSSYAASPLYGANLLGHELGHNLGLDHVNTRNDLMYPSLNANGLNTTLLPNQIALLLQSPLVQTDAHGQRFIEIAPYAIEASALPVPEPQSWGMLLCGLGVIGLLRRHRAKRATG